MDFSSSPEQDAPQFQIDTRLRQFVDATPSGILVVDEDGRIELVNSEAERMFGYLRTELVGQPVEVLIPKRLRSKHPDYRGSFFHTPEARRMGIGRDLTGVRQDGSEFPLEIGLSPIETEGRVRVLATTVDITQRKRVERTLAERSDELERSNRELETFAYVASHDLRAPLRGIHNLTRLLEEDLDSLLAGETRENMHLLRARVRRLEALLDDILEYSRVGRADTHHELTDSRAIIHDIVEILDVSEHFSVTVAPNLPTFDTDKARLEQVFRNLISNSIKHHDAEVGQIDVSVTDHGRFYLFTVADDGPGIPEELHQRVFEMFQTLRPRDDVEGSGMGLAIVKKLVELHNGQIWADSTKGERGVAFHFEWPKSWDTIG